jgi:hypothetical protein
MAAATLHAMSGGRFAASAPAPRSSRKACTTRRSSRRCRACAGWSRRSVRCSAASASRSR